MWHNPQNEEKKEKEKILSSEELTNVFQWIIDGGHIYAIGRKTMSAPKPDFRVSDLVLKERPE